MSTDVTQIDHTIAPVLGSVKRPNGLESVARGPMSNGPIRGLGITAVLQGPRDPRTP